MKKILVVDDDEDSVEVISDFLELHGMTIVGKGYNGKQALELFQQTNPDVVILDLSMPEYDGVYALEKIRKINPKAKVIVITAYSQTYSTELKKLEPNSIIIKPYDIEKLMKIIDEL